MVVVMMHFNCILCFDIKGFPIKHLDIWWFLMLSDETFCWCFGSDKCKTTNNPLLVFPVSDSTFFPPPPPPHLPLLRFISLSYDDDDEYDDYDDAGAVADAAASHCTRIYLYLSPFNIAPHWLCYIKGLSILNASLVASQLLKISSGIYEPVRFLLLCFHLIVLQFFPYIFFFFSFFFCFEV